MILSKKLDKIKKRAIENFLFPNLASRQDIEEAINSLYKFKEKLPPYSCHTQAVERTVQLVTQASKKVCGQEERDGFIRNTISVGLK